MAATKIKVIELAKELGVTSKDLMLAAEEMGHKGVRAMTPLDATLANSLRVKLGKGRELPEEPKDPAAELLAWASSHITDLRGRQALIRTCMGEFAEHPGLFVPENSGPVRAARSLAQYLRRLRQRGLAQAEFEPRAAAALLIGTLFADAMGREIMPDLYANEPDHAVREYVTLFLRGIGVNVKTKGDAR